MKPQEEKYRQRAYQSFQQTLAAILLQQVPCLGGPSDTVSEAIEDARSRLEIRLGAKKLVVWDRNEPRPVVRLDTFGSSAVDELIGGAIAFDRAMVCAHIQRTGSEVWAESERGSGTRTDEARFQLVTGLLWEAVEVGYFRACAYWDRVGQLLEFIFFNVRDYREGFSATIQRMKTNFESDELPMQSLAGCDHWQYLKKFRNRRHENLTSKRNVIAHRRGASSCRVEDSPSERDNYFDHLNATAGKFTNLDSEICFLNDHVKEAWEALPHVLELSLWWLENRSEGAI